MNNTLVVMKDMTWPSIIREEILKLYTQSFLRRKLISCDLSSDWGVSMGRLEYLISMYIFGSEPRRFRKKRDRKLLKVRVMNLSDVKRWGKTKSKQKTT
jgi:hypothetical protein